MRYPGTALVAMRLLLETVASGRVILERIDPERFTKACGLRERYADKPRISFTDFTSMVIMTKLGITTILTEDAHFMHVGLGLQRVP
jgi:predicted nucleic acid-binding protein